ncbi:hypothetical protein Lal_00036166 [Lupinus albus]|uniref:Putative HSP20-like chaperone n=1 Tax=Lupinus albus TaxID=3870 RepID=A0A6A5M876_LUPAL|nr:putative HSP20-like chaperone [Lupinus albus]KAF1868728.1 hypothetical protein Lal_00036166 [Lupinus albus]
MSLEQKVQPAERVYEEFEPPYDWAHDESSDTLILMLPGFRKEHLRVQIASNRVLRLSGERQINEKRWRKFQKQFSVPTESDTNGVSAKFESGMLYVKLPKLIKPTPQPPTPTTITPTPQKVPKPPQQPTPTPTTSVQQKVPKPPQQPTPPQAQPNNIQPHRANEQKPMDKASEANIIEKTNKPPTPTPTAPVHQEPKADEDSQNKPNLVQKAAEVKPEKTETPKAAPTPIVAPLEEPKKEVNDSQKKLSQKEKGKSKATTSKGEGVHEPKMGKRSQTLEMLSRQTQEYKNAVSDLVEELKKQKKLANLVVVIFLVLVIGLCIKNAMKSSLRGPKIEEL